MAYRGQVPKAIKALVGHILVWADTKVVRIVGVWMPLKVVGVVTEPAVESRIFRINSELEREADVLGSNFCQNIITRRGSELGHILKALTDGKHWHECAGVVLPLDFVKYEPTQIFREGLMATGQKYSIELTQLLKGHFLSLLIDQWNNS